VRVVTDNLGFLLGGLLITLELTAIGFVGALLLGTVLAVFRVSPIPPLRVAGAVYVEVLRNMPLLSLLILMVFGLPVEGAVELRDRPRAVSVSWGHERLVGCRALEPCH